MFGAARPFDAARVQRFVFCPKCRFEELGDVVAGQLEVEHEWNLHISTRSARSVSALRALRTVPELAQEPLTTLLRRLQEADVLTLGPFTRNEVRELLDELRAAGLVVEISADL